MVYTKPNVDLSFTRHVGKADNGLIHKPCRKPFGPMQQSQRWDIGPG